MWIVAQTKLKQEDLAKINLENQGFRTYLPKMQVKKFKLSKWIKSVQNLFPRYIFININNSYTKLSSINSTRGVTKLIVDRESGSPIKINESVISDIKILEKDININTLKPGSKAFITKGSSCIEVTYIRRKNKDKAIVKLNLLNDNFNISVNFDDLQYCF